MFKFFSLHFTLFTLRSFAFAGLFLVGNNVFAEQEVSDELDGHQGRRCSGTHAGLGNGYTYCPTCSWVPHAHPDSWTSGRCS